MKLSNNQQAFFALLRAGLWEKDVRLSQYHGIDYAAIMQLAVEQSVVGLVAAGLEHVSDIKPPKEVVLEFVGQTLHIEQRNRAMNAFVSELIEILRNKDIYALLVKGQGIAQCYERPLWRSSGDIDLLLSDDNYKKASNVLLDMATSVDEEMKFNQHLAMTIEGWPVELHGKLRSGRWHGMDKMLDHVQDSVFYEGKVRSWKNGKSLVFLPNADEDVIFVFSHILQHFFKEGIGLRQICDWCRLLWTYKDSIDRHLLERRLKLMGAMTEWKAFAAFVVNYLGMPIEAMPFYSESSKWSGKAEKIMAFVLETGNFGHNRDYSYYKKYPFVIFKAISLWRHLKDFGRYFVIFPWDAMKVTWRRMCVGFSVAIKGGTHI